MNELYPLKFLPIFKDKIWGGQKIKTKLGLDFSPLPNCGEVWVLSGVKGNESVVFNGFLEGNTLNELIEVFMYDLVGEENFEKFGEEFPILVKFIDANDWLSIQVHPDDILANKRKIGRGKTEMWYILEADESAQLISGFNKTINPQTYLKHLKDGTLKDIMNFAPVHKGDVFFMPAGRVHALGPGIMLAEIQETSDTTYRIYDWDRSDDQGKSRELHTEEALEAIDFNYHDDYKTLYNKQEDQTVNLVSCPHFTTNLVHLKKHTLKKDLSALDSFVAYICASGMAEMHYQGGKETLKQGEVILVPAMYEEISLVPLIESEILETFLL